MGEAPGLTSGARNSSVRRCASVTVTWLARTRVSDPETVLALVQESMRASTSSLWWIAITGPSAMMAGSFVGDDGGNLDDRVAVGLQPGHLQIDPDEVFGARHGLSGGDSVRGKRTEVPSQCSRAASARRHAGNGNRPRHRRLRPSGAGAHHDRRQLRARLRARVASCAVIRCAAASMRITGSARHRVLPRRTACTAPMPAARRTGGGEPQPAARGVAPLPVRIFRGGPLPGRRDRQVSPRPWS